MIKWLNEKPIGFDQRFWTQAADAYFDLDETWTTTEKELVDKFPRFKMEFFLLRAREDGVVVVFDKLHNIEVCYGQTLEDTLDDLWEEKGDEHEYWTIDADATVHYVGDAEYYYCGSRKEEEK